MPASRDPRASAPSETRDHPLPGSRITMTFRALPSASFLMGDCRKTSPEPDTRPAHRVEIDSFASAVHPVTNAQFQAFVDATGYQTQRERARPERPYWSDDAEYPHHPVIAINWLDAAAFCHWAGLRLMTEAEWEYASRGGLEGREFPWGDEPPASRCNWRDWAHRPELLRFSDLGGLTPVGSSRAERLGPLRHVGQRLGVGRGRLSPRLLQILASLDPPGPATDYTGQTVTASRLVARRCGHCALQLPRLARRLLGKPGFRPPLLRTNIRPGRYAE